MMLLAAEQGRSAPTIAPSVRENEQTVRTWLKRYSAAGIEGLHDAPRLGAPKNVTPVYVAQWHNVVRLRPRRLGLPYALWTLARLADSMAAQTGIRVEAETVRRYLHEAAMVLSRPQHTMSSPAPAYQGTKRRLQRPAMA